MGINETKAHRRVRVALLLDTPGLGQTELANRTGIQGPYLYQMSAKCVAPGSIRNVSDANARKIERGVGLPAGWLDGDDPVPDPLPEPGRPLPAPAVDAVTYALGAICTALAASQPAAGAAVAHALRTAPPKLAGDPVLAALQRALDRAASSVAAKPKAAPPGPPRKRP